MEKGERNLDNIDVSLAKVKEIIKDVRYGNIILLIQDGKIIQIDKTEKIRLQVTSWLERPEVLPFYEKS